MKFDSSDLAGFCHAPGGSLAPRAAGSASYWRFAARRMKRSVTTLGTAGLIIS